MGQVAYAFGAAKLRPPHPLTSEHTLNEFDCGEPSLNIWLARWGMANQASRASRSFVVTFIGGQEVLGFYSLASGSVSHSDCIRDLKRQMPDPVPVTILARLAVHRDHHGKGIGAGLLGDSIRRTLQISDFVGTAALLVHAIDKRAEEFYTKHGFKPSRVTASTLMLPVTTMLRSATANQ